MAQMIRFTTTLFDISKEDKNPINPIYGQSLLLWLSKQISKAYTFTKPDCEDWDGRTYINRS